MTGSSTPPPGGATERPEPSGQVDSQSFQTGGVYSSSGKDLLRHKVALSQHRGFYDGRVQTRFPPEPNGYLHIGHAKAISVNFDIAAEVDGTCNLRFDDTNPATASDDYAEAIADDLRWLGYKPATTFYASDYFGQLFEWALHLIDAGYAYVDDQSAEDISRQRGGFGQPGEVSPWRDRSPQENLALFEQMAAGQFEPGTRVLRAKIDMNHPNMTMRDPVMYRIRAEPHYRTGTRWHVYPNYDWAHGQSDAIEGVTHSFCSLEFSDNRTLYDWFIDHVPLTDNLPTQTEFARLELTHTITSKRLLRQLVESGQVSGWDDPRLPTLRALRRRGYPPSAIRAFCHDIGIARTNSRHAVELLESFVRTELNATALRRMAVLRPVKLRITNWPSDAEGQPVVEQRVAVNNPEDPQSGTREVPFSGELLIERDDVKVDPPPKYYRLAPGREVRLRAGYFVRCDEVLTNEAGEVTEVLCTYDPATGGGNAPDGRKVKATIHWVSAAHAVPIEVALYERLFSAEVPGAATGDPLDDLADDSLELVTGAVGEPALADVEPGQVVQFERLGYFAAEQPEHTAQRTGKPTLFHRTVGLRDEWANIQKRQAAKQASERKS